MEDIKKLAQLVKGIDFAMFSTTKSDGTIHSRPMSTQVLEFDGELWFFTSKDSEKITEIEQNPQVNVSYASSNKSVYISISGEAEVVIDQSKVDELWSPELKAWFSEGKNDPSIALIKVKVSSAEYWESPSNAVVKLISFVKAVATGEGENIGENKTINL